MIKQIKDFFKRTRRQYWYQADSTPEWWYEARVGEIKPVKWLPEVETDGTLPPSAAIRGVIDAAIEWAADEGEGIFVDGQHQSTEDLCERLAAAVAALDTTEDITAGDKWDPEIFPTEKFDE